MKWTVSNLIALVAVIGNVLQIISAWQKNRQDYQARNKSEENRAKEQKQSFEIQNKQMELQNENAKLQWQIELQKVKLSNQKDISEIELANQQASYDKVFPQAQSIFEEYVTTTRKVLDSQSFPYTFPDNYERLVSLVILYCPEATESIYTFELVNKPYKKDLTDLSKTDYINEQSKFMNETFTDIISTLSSQLYQRKQK